MTSSVSSYIDTKTTDIYASGASRGVEGGVDDNQEAQAQAANKGDRNTLKNGASQTAADNATSAAIARMNHARELQDAMNSLMNAGGKSISKAAG